MSAVAAGADMHALVLCFMICSALQIADFCSNYEALLGMGFAPSLAVGALLKTKNDMNAAPELCLSLNH
jgi:hypothetical protein